MTMTAEENQHLRELLDRASEVAGRPVRLGFAHTGRWYIEGGPRVRTGDGFETTVATHEIDPFVTVTRYIETMTQALIDRRIVE